MTTADKKRMLDLRQEVSELRTLVLGFVPTESFSNYKNPKVIKASFDRALRDYKAGRVSTTL